MRGGWRAVAAIMGFVVLRLIVGVSIDPASHNLWPFETLTAGVLSTIIMIVLLIAWKVSGAGRAS